MFFDEAANARRDNMLMVAEKADDMDREGNRGERFPRPRTTEEKRTPMEWEMLEEAYETAMMVKKTRRYLVAVYEEDQAYGGPEEGGWWYGTGRLMGVVRVVKNEERANEIARRINSLFAFRRRLYRVRDQYSAAYEGGDYRAHICKDVAPESYPPVHPHYE